MAKVYISGKITGLEYQDAFNNFERAEQEIKELGGTPVNPMKIEHDFKHLRALNLIPRIWHHFIRFQIFCIF